MREKMARRLWEFGIILMILAATTVVVGVIIIAIGMIFQEISSLSLTEILTAIIFPNVVNCLLDHLYIKCLLCSNLL